MVKLNHLLDEFLNLFLKSNCPLCRRPAEQTLCDYCGRKLQGCQLSEGGQLWRPPLPVFVWGRYGSTLKQAIATLKYENHPQLAQPLGHWMAEAWIESGLVKNQKLTVVPVPLHPEKLRQRGFNQAELLAKSFAEVMGWPVRAQGLERIRETQAQFGLSPSQRQQNLKGAFAVGKAFRHRHPKTPVLLVDDIYTTGATVKAAAEVLRGSGIEVYGVVALAAPQPGQE